MIDTHSSTTDRWKAWKWLHNVIRDKFVMIIHAQNERKLKNRKTNPRSQNCKTNAHIATRFGKGK